MEAMMGKERRKRRKRGRKSLHVEVVSENIHVDYLMKQRKVEDSILVWEFVEMVETQTEVEG